MALQINSICFECLSLLNNFPCLGNVDFDNRRWEPPQNIQWFHAFDISRRSSLMVYSSELIGGILLTIECRFYACGLPNSAAATVKLTDVEMLLSLDDLSVRFLAPAVAAIGNTMIAVPKGEGPVEIRA